MLAWENIRLKYNVLKSFFKKSFPCKDQPGLYPLSHPAPYRSTEVGSGRRVSYSFD